MNSIGNLATLIGDLYGAIEHRIVAGWHYRKARTFQDLLNIEIADTLADRDREGDPIEWDLFTTHLGLLRAGVFVTGISSSGSNKEFDLEYRAVVTGLADEETKDWIDDAIYRAEAPYKLHVYELFVPGDPSTGGPGGEPAEGVPPMRRLSDGSIVPPGMGRQQTAREILGTYPVPRAVRDELTSRWQITIYDPQWNNDSDLLFFLQDIARVRQHTLAGK